MLTNFASPSILIIAEKWQWSALFMMTTFGWKAAVGVTLATSLYFFLFRKEFDRLDHLEKFHHMFVKQ